MRNKIITNLKSLDCDPNSDSESSIDDDEESYINLIMEKMKSSNQEIDEVNMDCTDETGMRIANTMILSYYYSCMIMSVLMGRN